MGIDYDNFDGSVMCAHCKYRFSWDCDDGLAYPKNGCDDFSLDVNTLDEDDARLLLALKLLRMDDNG